MDAPAGAAMVELMEGLEVDDDADRLRVDEFVGGLKIPVTRKKARPSVTIAIAIAAPAIVDIPSLESVRKHIISIATRQGRIGL